MSRSRISRRLAAQGGFTLPELLVVILIVGILAAIAVAMLLTQRAKAQDADAKSAATTAATAMQVFNQDHGDFDGATPADLARIEPALGKARGLTVTSDLQTFTVTVDSAAVSGATYSVQRTSAGQLVRTCSKPGVGSCQDTADASGNRW